MSNNSPNSPHRSEQSLRAPPSPSIPLQDLERQQGDNGNRFRGHQPQASMPLGLSSYWETYHQPEATPSSPIDAIDPMALQSALPPQINPTRPPIPRATSSPGHPYAATAAYYDETPPLEDVDSDRAPLTSAAQPISGALGTPEGATPRTSFQTVSDMGGNSPGKTGSRSTRMLGFDLESGFASPKHRSYGVSLSPAGERLSRSAGRGEDALHRAGSMVRAMSQRVVNIGGEGESVEHQERRNRSRSPSMDGRPSVSMNRPSIQMEQDTSYPSQFYPTSPSEKKGPDPDWTTTEPVMLGPRKPMANPLKGRSLGIFPGDSPLRRKLCDLLVNPWVEPFILILIVLQAVLLAVESANNVYTEGNGRPSRWDATSPISWTMLGLFIIFTLEMIARIIVSGFIMNAAEYSTIDRKKGFRTVISDQYNAYFRPHRQKSVRVTRQEVFGPSTFARSFTMMHGQALPETVEEQQRMQLARRAFLRHGFNRVDFIAVISYWITLLLSISGLEAEHHIYVFRMLSCLRIARLLALTNGTAIILQSLKKAAPLLVRVSFLIGFFWLLFAIIGVQSFKSSLRRTCVWRDPLQPDNFSASFTIDEGFCGGFLSNDTGDPLPWMKSPYGLSFDDLKNGTDSAKGFLCPRGSICLEQGSPYNNTVNFDNIINSIELVFVIMSANTWSDLMYYTTKSDFTPAALFFGGGIMIMMLWLTNLLIAVITSSFQVIREESKKSAFTSSPEQADLDAAEEDELRRKSTFKRVYDKSRLLWVFIIATGLFIQAFRESGMDPFRERVLVVSEIVVTSLLDLDIVLRFLSDWRRFHRSYFNLFDLFLAVATTVIQFPPIRENQEVYAWLTAFQILRVYRVVLAIPMTRQLILQILGDASGVANLIIFVCLACFITSILAVQLFRGEIPLYDDGGELIRISFYNIFNSFLGMYQILSSENWTAILYSVTGYTTFWNTSWYAAMFLIGWFILSWFIIVNMFIAVIQENFDVSEDEKRLEQVKAFLQKKELGRSATSNLALSEIFTLGKNRGKLDPLDYGPATMEMLLKETVVTDFLDYSELGMQGESAEDHAASEESPEDRPGVLSSTFQRVKKVLTSREPNPFYSDLRFETPKDATNPHQMARQAVSATAARRKAQREYLARHPKYNNALYVLTPQNPIRRACQRLVGPGRGSERHDGVEPNKIAWYTFSAFIYAAITAMVIIACITTPLYQKLNPSNWFIWTDAAFAILFTVEAVIKILADGFLFTPNAYYRSSWGIIDGVVLITLWVNVIATLSASGSVSRFVGAFKALRALRLLNISNSARNTFHSLIIVAGWKIISAAFVSLSLIIPFAIYAVNLFNGKLIQCNDGDVGKLSDCFGEFQSSPYNEDWPMLAPRVADNQYFHFDDFGTSLFVLFQIVSQEGWVDVSFAAQSITGRNSQPQDMAAPGNAMFFVIFNILGTVFVLTLFISVFMRNYTEQTGVAFLTAEQRSWLELRKLLRQISPSRTSYDDSKKKWKKWCHKRAIEKRGVWYTSVTVLLVCHLFLLMVEYYPEPEWWSITRSVIFLLFTLIYIANIVIRIVGLGWRRFRKSSWDVYSLFVVFGAFVTSALLVISREMESLAQIHKFFLVAILLLLIPRNDALDQLFKTAAASLTTIINLLATWFVFFIMFAIALTQTFSLTRFGGNEDTVVNFRTVPNALILLFRMSVGEGWNELMEDYANILPPLCVENSDFSNSDCGSSGWARSLFVAWNIISMYIFVNLFISLIYESFSYVYQRSSGLSHLDRDDIRRFKEAWRSVDPGGSGFITKEAFPRLLGELSGIFEMRIYDSDDSVGQIIGDVQAHTQHSRHASISTASGLHGLDLDALNQRLARLDVAKIRERRRRFNLFYEEVMVSADPNHGVSFTTVLMILAHYNIITDAKSLKLEEFLRRRARLQRVEEEVRRKIVLGFFDTLYWSRKFKRHMEKKGMGRMTAIPQLDIPDIFVDDEDDRQRVQQRATVAAPQSTEPFPSPGFLNPSRSGHAHHQSWSSSGDISTPFDSSSRAHPFSLPRLSTSTPGRQPQGAGAEFEVQEPGPPSNASSRRGSAVSPAQVRDLLDDSLWVESIRRSATIRRSVRKSDWGNFR